MEMLLGRHIVRGVFHLSTQCFYKLYLLEIDAGLESFTMRYEGLSHDVSSGSEITPCNKIDKPLVVYRFSGNVMTSITTLRT